jgi:myo-inositol-1(or 4)-monophosphatase
MTEYGLRPPPAMRTAWLGFCRDVAGDVAAALVSLPTRDHREPVVGRGEGGDDTVAIDRAAEDAAVGRLEELHRSGLDFRLVSEELGERAFGGGEWRVVVDPIDGSLNAKRLLPYYCISIAFAHGRTIDDVCFAYVRDLAGGEEWIAERGAGATLDGRPLGDVRPKERLGVVSLEVTDARRIADAAARLDGHVGRIRVMGALALSLCQLAAGRCDAVAALKPARSVDLAAATLIVREAGAAVLLPDRPALPLDLSARSRAVAARDEQAAGRLAGMIFESRPEGPATSGS